jgi:hypothetical protein
MSRVGHRSPACLAIYGELRAGPRNGRSCPRRQDWRSSKHRRRLLYHLVQLFFALRVLCADSKAASQSHWRAWRACGASRSRTRRAQSAQPQPGSSSLRKNKGKCKSTAQQGQAWSARRAGVWDLDVEDRSGTDRLDGLLHQRRFADPAAPGQLGKVPAAVVSLLKKRSARSCRSPRVGVLFVGG